LNRHQSGRAACRARRELRILELAEAATHQIRVRADASNVRYRSPVAPPDGQGDASPTPSVLGEDEAEPELEDLMEIGESL
jgi:hypothetical protein